MSKDVASAAEMPLPPVLLARALERIRNGLIRLYRKLVPAPAAMLEMITAAWLTQALHVAARLGVADRLAQGPMTAEDLAGAVGAHPDALRRLLRVLTAEGVFKQRRDGRYALNTLGAVLRADSPFSVRSFALFVGNAAHWEHWAHLLDSVRSGEVCVTGLRGMPFFDYLQHDPALAADFNGAMISISNFARSPILAAYDFSKCGTVADIGGGHGRLLALILARHPGLRGVLYDLPAVVAGAPEVLRAAGVAERCRIEAGSFFDRVPAGADVYILKHIVHDWEESKALQILRKVRAAAAPQARLLLMEVVLPERHSRHAGNLVDLEMLACTGGRERTAAGYGELLAQAGFRMTRCKPTVGPVSIVEAAPA